jgi:hypothetical protein
MRYGEKTLRTPDHIELDPTAGHDARLRVSAVE